MPELSCHRCKAEVPNLIAMFLVTSPIVINVPTRGLLAVETMHAIVRWLVKFEYQKKYDVNVCKQETSLLFSV